jgi:hypothetical protein
VGEVRRLVDGAGVVHGNWEAVVGSGQLDRGKAGRVHGSAGLAGGTVDCVGWGDEDAAAAFAFHICGLGW